MLDFCKWETIEPIKALALSGLFNDYIYEQTALPFYKTIKLARCRHRSEEEQYLYYLIYKNMALELSGPSDNIYEANDLDGVFINKDNVIQYIKFFCYFIKADGSNFIVIENCDDEDLEPINNDLDEGILSRIGKMEYLGYNQKMRHEVSGIVRYKESLFRAKYEIETDGHVEMIDEEEIYEKSKER